MANPTCNPYAYSTTAPASPRELGTLTYEQYLALPPCQTNYTPPAGVTERQQTNESSGGPNSMESIQLTQAQRAICERAGVGRQENGRLNLSVCKQFLESQFAQNCVGNNVDAEKCRAAGTEFMAQLIAGGGEGQKTQSGFVAWLLKYWWIVALILLLIGVVVYFFV